MTNPQNKESKNRTTLVIGIVVAFFGLLIVFSKSSNNNDNNTQPVQNTTDSHRSNTKTVYINGYATEIIDDNIPPNGYEKGETCSDCNGSGVVLNPVTNQECVCAACNGRGYLWVKINRN